MKENILEIMKRIDNLSKEFNFSEIETAFYIYARYGEDDYTEEQIKDVYEAIVNTDDTLFNEDINEETKNIIGG